MTELVVRGVAAVTGHMVPITVLTGTLIPWLEVFESMTIAEHHSATWQMFEQRGRTPRKKEWPRGSLKSRQTESMTHGSIMLRVV